MKKVLSTIIVLCIVMLNGPLYAKDEALSENEHTANQDYESLVDLLFKFTHIYESESS